MRRALMTLAALFLLPAGGAAQVVEYYHLDALGSVRVVTSQNGLIVESHDYKPFAEEWNASSPRPGESPVRFAGKERDAETGLDYFGGRYLSARVARFTTVDPVYIASENLVDPQRWNKYAYARNGPLRYTDPDGRILDTILDIGFVAYDLIDIGVTKYTGGEVTRAQKAALAADLGATLIPFATGAGAAVRAATRAEHAIDAARATKSGAELVLDTNAVITHGKHFVKSGDQVVKSVVTDVELAALAKRGKITMPKAAQEIPSVGLPGVHTRINVRAKLPPRKKGNFADGIIGATALERGSTLVTKDKGLAKAVRESGGKVIEP
jgi:RHS repeat-associated protein